MSKKRKMSADEIRSKRKDHLRETERGIAVLKATKAPPTSWDPDKRSARFVMTSQGGDRYGDIIKTEGVDVAEFERNPVGLLFHNSDIWPVANWSNIEKILKGRPPRIEGDFDLLPAGGPVKTIDEAAWMIEHGGIRACSIGFIPDWDAIELVEDEEENWTGGFIFNKSELVECSVCAVPANPDAMIKMAGRDLQLAKELVEDVLDNWQRTPEGLLIPREDFEKAYRITVEKIAATSGKTERQSNLPTTDEEILAADKRALEFEVAKICPPLEGLAVAVDGDVKAKLIVVNGKMQHAGDVSPTDVVNMIVSAKSADGKTSYSVSHNYAKGYKLNDKKEWVSDVEPAEKTEKEATDSLEIKLDTTEFQAEVGKLSSMFDGFAETIGKLFGSKKTEEDRVEPKVDEPAAPPSAEAIAAAKERAVQATQRAAKHLT